MTLGQRIVRHARITVKAFQSAPDPPFLILFVNSLCNQQCDHCFYWRNLNRNDDLSFDELVALSESLGRVENLNLSGGEPFLRKDLGKVCRQFVRANGVRQIYCPTNASFADKTVEQLQETLREPGLELFAVEISLEGLADFHDRFRHMPGAFDRAMETYDALAELQKKDPRVRIHASSTATGRNMDELARLTTHLYERCPAMDHHNLVLIRGDRKDPSLRGPALEEFRELYDYMRSLWRPREEGRYGAIAEPMTQWAKRRTAAERRQVVPCKAGKLSAVVYSNGDVSVCENHPPLGNLRERPFNAIWRSAEADARRRSIAAKQCHCTNEMFLWPSVVFQPASLARSFVGARAWRKPRPLAPERLVAIEPVAETARHG